MHTVLLALHISAGGLGLLAAALAVLARKRRGWHTLLGRVFALMVVLVCVTAFALIPFAPEQWWLGIIAAATLAVAGAGVYLAWRKPVPWWYTAHLNLMLSAGIAFVTPVTVQIFDAHLLSWVLPTVFGAPVIAYRTGVARGAVRPWHRLLMPWRPVGGSSAPDRREADATRPQG